MLHRLGAHQEVVDVMTSRRQLLPLMRYIKQHATVTVSGATLLKVAMESEDAILFHTTYRFVQAMHYQVRAVIKFASEKKR